MYDTIIIGAGMSGLAAGIRLALFNKRVCIVERHSMIGGLNSFYRLGERFFDVGLHAITNFVPKGTRRGPMARMLRQLRFSWDELGLVPQIGSCIAFPGVQLRFNNNVELLISEIGKAFPSQKDNFQRLLDRVMDYEELGTGGGQHSARGAVCEVIDDPLLVEMLFCPLLFYGGAKEHDMDFGQFSIMFRSIFLEGLARPFAGVRLLLKTLVKKFKMLGGELRLRAGVERIKESNGRADGVVLEDGTELAARQVLSSAGFRETMRLCKNAGRDVQEEVRPGQLSFVESISVLDKEPTALGHDRTIVFFNNGEKFEYRNPDDIVDLRSGVICSPNNFAYEESLSEGVMRITSLANYERWAAMPSEKYREAKQEWFPKIVEAAVRHVPDFRGAIVESDMFTPTTIRRFTGHERGAVYGAAEKRYDGTTHLKNLFICGTDQGMVGIIGTLVSGITIANRYFLRGS